MIVFVHGHQGKSGLVTHVDRASRFLALGRIADRSAASFMHTDLRLGIKANLLDRRH